MNHLLRIARRFWLPALIVLATGCGNGPPSSVKGPPVERVYGVWVPADMQSASAGQPAKNPKLGFRFTAETFAIALPSGPFVAPFSCTAVDENTLRIRGTNEAGKERVLDVEFTGENSANLEVGGAPIVVLRVPADSVTLDFGDE